MHKPAKYRQVLVDWQYATEEPELLPHFKGREAELAEQIEKRSRELQFDMDNVVLHEQLAGQAKRRVLKLDKDNALLHRTLTENKG